MSRTQSSLSPQQHFTPQAGAVALKAQSSDQATGNSLSFLHQLLGDYHPRDFAVRLWNDVTWEAEAGQPTRFTLVLQHPGALRRMFWPPDEVSFGEAYIYDDCDIEGDLGGVLPLAEYLSARKPGLTERLRLMRLLFRLPSEARPRDGRGAAQLSGRPHSIARDRQAIAYHYNVSNDFFALWLDQRMVYSCAYFASPAEDLDTAQERKLDYLCRKLRLRRNEQLLDIGCGWGGLIIHAAKNYGVRAHGITLSEPQAALARERIRQAGLSDRCRAEVCDYRQLDRPEAYDKLVSVGMFEHVGEALLPAYFNQAWRLLRPGGVFLNHGIARSGAGPLPRGHSFVDRYIFPDGELVPVSTTVRVAEECGFEVRDVENLREHYALTLRHWAERLEAHHDEVCRLTDETTYRIWRLMCSSAEGFERGQLSLCQTLLSRPDQGRSRLPLTRADWYAGSP